MFRPYNQKVLIGNWYEDRALEEDVIKDFLEKRRNGELVSQKSANDTENAPASLTTVNDGRIHVGDRIMLKCDGNQNNDRTLLPKPYRNDCYLYGSSGAIYGTPNQSITSNSVFKIKSVDGSPIGTPICFGQRFAIVTYDENFYLHSDTRLIDRATKKSRLQLVDLVDVYNHECDWVATCLNPKFRLECEGAPIPANQKIVLLHMKTNKGLAVVTDFNKKSSFEIVANTFLDSHKAEEDVNHWKFVTNIPTIDAPEVR